MCRQSLRLAAVAPAVGLLALAAAGAGCAARQPSRARIEPVPNSASVRTIESTDARLAAAIAALGSRPTPSAIRAVAIEYSRLGVFDRAIAWLTRAIELAPSDPEMLAARARAWRDWGRPDAALGDAHRAVFLGPKSPEAYNTLGTVQFALGQAAEATASFERALALAPQAPWALNNLCYVALIAGDAAVALARCAAALESDPESAIIRNNLALVHAAAGRLDEARAAFLASGHRASALYNFGIVLMARRDYAAAAEAFGGACRIAQSFDEACRRAVEARKLAQPPRSGRSQ